MLITPRRAKRKKRDADGYADEGPWEKHIAFATNDPDIDVEEYSGCRSLETEYRLLEHIRIRTRSRHHGSRVMCMAMTVMLFNSWILADALIRSGLQGAGHPDDDQVVLHADRRTGADDEEGPGPGPLPRNRHDLPSLIRQASRAARGSCARCRRPPETGRAWAPFLVAAARRVLTSGPSPGTDPLLTLTLPPHVS